MKQKVCLDCRIEKDLVDFSNHGHAKDGKQKYCKDCSRKNLKKYRASNGDRYAQTNRLRLKMEVLKHYSPDGPKCACCGITEHEFLAIDHIDGGGNQHRKATKSTIYNWLKRNNYPSGYRVLCHNCNMAYGLFGYCPHQSSARRRMVEPTLSEKVRKCVLDAARSLAEQGIYPSVPMVVAKCGHGISVVQQHKQRIMKDGEWPMQGMAEKIAKQYRPDLHAA